MHLTCLNCLNQNAIQLQNVSNLIATHCIYQYRKHTYKHEG